MKKRLLFILFIVFTISCKKEDDIVQQPEFVTSKIFIRTKNISAFRLYDVRVDVLRNFQYKSYGELFTNQITDYIGFEKVYQPLRVRTYNNPNASQEQAYGDGNKSELKPGKYTLEVFLSDNNDKYECKLTAD